LVFSADRRSKQYCANEHNGQHIDGNCFQETGQSCLTCHGYGQPDRAPQPLAGTNQIFTFILSNADTALGAAATLKAMRQIKLLLERFPHRQVMKSAPPRKKK
jgi:hypothetical protein